MSAYVRWGILGAAKFARTTMGPAIHAAGRGRLAALATGSAEKAAPFVAMTPGLRVHHSYEALLADPEIDAVYIPLPNHLHVEWALRAMDAGKHVLVEKPLAMRAEDFDTVIAKRDATGLVAAEAFMIVHHPQWQHVRDLLAEEAVGPLQRATASFSYNNPDGANIRNRPETGGGALGDIGVYVFGGVRFATGSEPERILSAEVIRENGVDVTAHVTAAFPGFHYSGFVSMRAAPLQEVVFHGESGLIRLTAPFNPQSYGEAVVEIDRAVHGGGAARREILRFTKNQQYVTQVEAFNAAVLDAVPFPCSLEFVRGTQQMIDAVHRAESV
ncbi:Gfo/Idh/MocA family protein [Cognatishimia sp. F0-27]|uniref:Gfo/Idh/MocA family protein n=1 Tax=Cognatishimia sp. F0-27 TaxID=2816855 RepID=UPI001D0BF954|nr:Gfo/Idh/MocA family oxidoreductase [Cognatishimia sp. F0-27]MCC1493671.1 Gfo/Idh/MocA family oxidoreductase [Cognatishimia sp. F0-27]